MVRMIIKGMGVDMVFLYAFLSIILTSVVVTMGVIAKICHDQRMEEWEEMKRAE